MSKITYSVPKINSSTHTKAGGQRVKINHQTQKVNSYDVNSEQGQEILARVAQRLGREGCHNIVTFKGGDPFANPEEEAVAATPAVAAVVAETKPPVEDQTGKAGSKSGGKKS